jgi:transketolase
MSPTTRRRPLRGGPRIEATAGQAGDGQPPEQPRGKRLTTSAMIASLAAEGQRTRPAPFGHALAEVARERPEIVGMTADLGKYTDLHVFGSQLPDRYYQMGMAEQLLMLAAAGMAHEGFVPFVTTYAVFASRRTYDFVSQGIAEEGLNVKVCCALPGLTTGYGPSHQATEDIAIFRGMPDLTIVDPCDALDTEQATRAIAAHDGPVYMRLLRGNVPLVLDGYDYAFELGKAKLLRDGADALVVSSGFMTMRALEAAELLEADRVGVAVLHVPTIKPLDEATIVAEARRGGRLVVVAENHSVIGGLGEAVAAALLRAGAAPRSFRQVALPDAFLDAGALPTLHERYGISADAMARNIKSWL